MKPRDRNVKRCKRCQYVWLSSLGRPVACARCGSRHWDRARRKGELGRPPDRERNNGKPGGYTSAFGITEVTP